MTEYRIYNDIFVTTQFVGFHRWPDAPPPRQYLASLHRHVFHIKVEVSVLHNDREIEYHDLKEALDQFLDSSTLARDFSSKSCEKIAEEILDWLRVRYPDREAYSVTVSEDDENGSSVTAQKQELA